MNETRLDIFNGAFFGILFFQLIEPLTAPGHWLASFPYGAVFIGAIGGWLIVTALNLTLTGLEYLGKKPGSERSEADGRRP
ncbi:hypothetical protein [Asaia astilbis]